MTDPGQTLTPQESQRWVRIGVLSALAIILGYLETFVPIPIPGVKLGLANIAILIALAQHDVGGAFGIAVIKVLTSGLLFGSPVTMAYSLVGTLLAFCLMAPLSQLPTMHLAMVSVVGALAHEAGQLLVAMWLLGTPLVWYSATLLMPAGCVTGALCGIVAARTAVLIEEGISPGVPVAACPPEAPVGTSGIPSHETPANVQVSGRVALLGFIAFCVFVLHAASPAALCLALACAFGACAVGRVRPRDVGLAFRPLSVMLLVTLVAQVANTQVGTTLVTLGSINVTREALTTTAVMMSRLLALTSAGLAVMRLASLESLVDAVAWMASPLGRLGVPTVGFILALQTALRFVPVFAATIQAQSGSLRDSMRGRTLLRETFPRIIAQLYQSASAGPNLT